MGIVTDSVQSQQDLASPGSNSKRMEFEERFTHSGEDKISQRRPEYSEDDITRRFIGSFTFPRISYLFGLQNTKLRAECEGSLAWLLTKPSLSTFNSQSSEDIEEAMAGGLNKANIYMPPI